jgi:hypothetical protein
LIRHDSSDLREGNMDDDARFVRDRMDITNLIHSYGHFADSGDTDAFAALFAADASIDIGISGVSDTASLKRLLEQRPAGPQPKTRHVMTNLYFRNQSGAEAAGACYLVFTSTSENRLTPVATGQYHFHVAKQDGAWRIRRWRAELDSALG